MNTYEYATLPKTWRAALGCAYSKAPDVCIWGPDAYEIILSQIGTDEFCDFLHLKWLIYDLGELLTAIMAD